MQESTIPDYDVGGVGPWTIRNPLDGIAPSNIYQSSDGSWIVIAANQDTVFRRLCGAMGRPELADDPDYVDHVARTQSGPARRDHRRVGSAAFPTDLVDTLSAAGVIAGPINTVAEVVNDPQLVAREMIIDHWDERANRNVKGPASFRNSPNRRALCATPAGRDGTAQRRGVPRSARLHPERLDQLTEDGIL